MHKLRSTLQLALLTACSPRRRVEEGETVSIPSDVVGYDPGFDSTYDAQPQTPIEETIATVAQQLLNKPVEVVIEAEKESK